MASKIVDYKALFLNCFPSKQYWRDFLRWRAELKRRQEIQRRLNAQRAEIEEEMLAMTNDLVDDDFDPIADDIWEQVKDS